MGSKGRPEMADAAADDPFDSVVGADERCYARIVVGRRCVISDIC